MHRADQAGVLATCEVCASDDMCVIEAEASRPGDKRQAPLAARWDGRGAFFASTIDVHWHELAVPMHLLGRLRLVVNVDD